MCPSRREVRCATEGRSCVGVAANGAVLSIPTARVEVEVEVNWGRWGHVDEIGIRIRTIHRVF